MAEEEEAVRVKKLEAVRAKKFAHTLKVIKRAVLEIQWLLLDGVDTDEQLHAAGELLVKSEYADVVQLFFPVQEYRSQEDCNFSKSSINLFKTSLVHPSSCDKLEFFFKRLDTTLYSMHGILNIKKSQVTLC